MPLKAKNNLKNIILIEYSEEILKYIAKKILIKKTIIIL